MRRALRWIARSRGGSAAIEFAIVLPVMLLLLGGMTEFGLAFQVYNCVNRIATQYATAWADCSDYPTGTCQTELATYTAANAIANIAPQLVTSRLTLTMFQVQMSGTTPNVVYSYPTGGSLTAAQTSAAQAAFSNGQSGIIVTASYSHSLMIFSSLMGPFLNGHLSPAYTVTQLKS